MVGGLSIVQWVGNKQVGLSPGQTRGAVNGVIVTRPAGQDVNTVYSPGVGSTSTKIDKEGNATIVKKDQYGNVIEITQRGSSGTLLFQRKTTLYGGSVESGLPTDISRNVKDIQTQQENIAQYRKAAEYKKAQEVRQQQEQREVSRFQLPGASDLYQKLYAAKLPKEKEYYAVQHPSGFGKVQLYSEYKPSDQFKLFGVIPAGKPEPGGLYRSDILGFTKKVGSINQTEARELATKPHKTTSLIDLKLNQAGNMLLFSPFAFGSLPPIIFPEIKLTSTTEIKSIPGLAVFKTQKTGIKISKQNQILEQIADNVAIKKEFTNNFYGIGETKYKPISKTAPIIDLSFEPIMQRPSASAINLAYRQGTKYRISTPSTSQRSIIAVLEKAKSQELLRSRSIVQPVTKSKLLFGQKSMTSSFVGLGISQRSILKQNAETKQISISKQVPAQIATLKSIQRSIQIPVMTPVQIYVPSLVQPTKQTTKQTTEQKPPKEPTKRPPRSPGKPIIRIPKVPVIAMPSIELPEMNLGISFAGKKRGTNYKKIKTKMLTLKDLLGK